ncbi:MAG: glycosyltransferase family 4 protein [Novosphingobium sp.]|uniref:glycosyltransferase family 4 protein n=1 Tax=Novosphingobium sp. TaxID=1874826 RepID=UPI0030172188
MRPCFPIGSKPPCGSIPWRPDSRRMRFLVVSHFYAGHGGGIERVAAQMCNHLAARGHAVSWAASAGDDPLTGKDVAIAALPCINPTEALTGLPMPIPGPRGMARLWSATKAADMVVVHDALYCTSILAAVFAKMQRKPVILVQHVAEIAFASARMRRVMALANRLVTRPMLRGADQVVFISDTVRQFFGQLRMKRPPLLQFNGVDTGVFHPGQAERSVFNLPASGLMVAFVGRFVEKKGLSILQAVARQSPDIQFALAGAGPIDPCRWDLPNVHVLGALPPERIAALFRSADCLLLPSVGEGYPLVIQEALAVGLTVICGEESARADPAASAWLQGVEIDLQDVAGSAARVARVVNENEARSEASRQAVIDYSQRHYSWAGFAARLESVGQALTRRS